MSVIKINTNDAYKVKIEGGVEAAESFMKDVYSNAFKSISEIQVNNKDIIEEEFNNVIAFLGERGSGKTSAMKSVVGMLKNTKDLDEINNNFLKDGNCKLNGEFLALETIDPSKLEQNESILKIILARMFKTFKDDIGNNGSKIKILQQFEEVYQNIQIVTGEHKSKYDHGLEALDNLGEGCDLVKSFKRLVEEYLNIMSKKSKDNQYLLISIDDVDMNIKNSYEIMEEIRKYLQVPNVIVMISMKIEQITNSIEEKFINEYKNIFKNNNQKLINEPNLMATRYLEKLIPLPRRLNLPKLSVKDKLDSLTVEIYENENKLAKFTGTLSDVIFELIFKKTGIVLLKPKNGIHELIPQNLREVHNFIGFLRGLQDGIDKEKSDNSAFKDNILLGNLEQLEEYLLYDWVEKNITSKDEINLINKIVASPIESLNKNIIFELNKNIQKDYSTNNKSTDMNLINENKIDRMRNSSSQAYNHGLRDGINLVQRRLNSEIDEVVRNVDINDENITIGDVLDKFGLYQNDISKELLCTIKLIYMIKVLRKLFSNPNKGIALEEIAKVYGGNIFGNITFNALPAGGGISSSNIKPIYNNRASMYIGDYKNIDIEFEIKEGKIHHIDLYNAIDIVNRYLLHENEFLKKCPKDFSNIVKNEYGSIKEEELKEIMVKIIKQIKKIHCYIIPTFFRLDNNSITYDLLQGTTMLNGKPFSNDKSKAFMNLLTYYPKIMMGNRVIKDVLEQRLFSLVRHNGDDEADKLVNMAFEKLDSICNENIDIKDIYLIFSIDFITEISRSLSENRNKDIYKGEGGDYKKIVKKMFKVSIYKRYLDVINKNSYIKDYCLYFGRYKTKKEDEEIITNDSENKNDIINDIKALNLIYINAVTSLKVYKEYNEFWKKNIQTKGSDLNEDENKFNYIYTNIYQIDKLSSTDEIEDEELKDIFNNINDKDDDIFKKVNDKLGQLKEKITNNTINNETKKASKKTIIRNNYKSEKFKKDFEKQYNKIKESGEHTEFKNLYEHTQMFEEAPVEPDKKLAEVERRKKIYNKLRELSKEIEMDK